MHGDKWGFGGSALNKLMARAEGMGSEHASDSCHRHGQKLVLRMGPYNIQVTILMTGSYNIQVNILMTGPYDIKVNITHT